MRQLRHVLRLAGATAEDSVITEADLDLPPFGGQLGARISTAAERAAIVEALRMQRRARDGGGEGAEAEPRDAVPQDQGAEDRAGRLRRACCQNIENNPMQRSRRPAFDQAT